MKSEIKLMRKDEIIEQYKYDLHRLKLEGLPKFENAKPSDVFVVHKIVLSIEPFTKETFERILRDGR